MDIAFNFGNTSITLTISSVVIAGWTGRDTEAVQHHISELAELGIAPPSQVPLYYRVSNALLTQDNMIEVLGGGSSGEVEPFLVRSNGKTYLGLASDHTDRDLEVYSVAASKQVCAKPVANELWDFDRVKGHLDAMTLKCWIEENGREVLYQDGTLSNIRPLTELCKGSGFADGTAMLCGTFAGIGGVRPASKYRMELSDPTNGKTMTLSYGVSTLPIIS
ncbi:MAG: DUF2848 domain-containing protein [Pseudomonadota bacterium]